MPKKTIGLKTDPETQALRIGIDEEILPPAPLPVIPFNLKWYGQNYPAGVARLIEIYHRAAVSKADLYIDGNLWQANINAANTFGIGFILVSDPSYDETFTQTDYPFTYTLLSGMFTVGTTRGASDIFSDNFGDGTLPTSPPWGFVSDTHDGFVNGLEVSGGEVRMNEISDILGSNGAEQFSIGTSISSNLDTWYSFTMLISAGFVYRIQQILAAGGSGMKVFTGPFIGGSFITGEYG